MPATTSAVVTLANTNGGFCRAVLVSTGKLRLLNNAGTQVGSDSAATMVADTWYRIELAQKIVSGANDDYIELRLDGISVASTTTANQGTLAGTYQLIVGWQVTVPGANKVCYADDVGINDDTGGSQNSWPDEGKVSLLVPISDNARDTLWTGGVGGTTNLWDAVDNRPPQGTDTESNTTQIEHAGNSGGTTDRYDANMTTYGSAGIGPFDSINVIQLFAIHGEDATTGAKLLAFSVLSNPAIASSGNVTVGDATPSALLAFPSEWGLHQGTQTYGSAVDVGVSPVMRVVRPETATRVASVCFMGIYVDYTPQPMRDEPKAGHYPQLLAH